MAFDFILFQTRDSRFPFSFGLFECSRRDVVNEVLMIVRLVIVYIEILEFIVCRKVFRALLKEPR